MRLLWYHYRTLRTLSPEQYPGLAVWQSAYSALPQLMCDRQNAVRPPIAVIRDPATRIPDLSSLPHLSFDESCALRANEILERAEAQDKPIYLMFSGGIDSTTVAVAFLRSFPVERLRDRLKIVTSPEAWVENPDFVRQHLVGSFEFLSARRAGLFFDGRALIVTGDLNEYYVSNSMFRNVYPGMTPGAEIPRDRYSTDALRHYFLRCSVPSSHANVLTQVFDDSRARAPVAIETLLDMLWWIRFNWTWQLVQFHSIVGVNPLGGGIASLEEFHDRVFHFFGSQAFQIWAMAVNTDRSSRKNACRAFIRSFTHDDEWIANKQKFHSLKRTQRSKKNAVGIDEQFNFIYSPEVLLQYYDPGNDFRAL